MRLLLALLLCVLPSLAQAAPVQGEWAATEHTRVRLVAPEAVGSNTPFFLGVEVEIQPEWHTYWLNPGDSGIPTRVKTTLPEGFIAGPLHFPVPHRFEMEGLLNYGYTEKVVFLLPITPKDVKSGESYEAKAQVDMLVCKDICVPEKAQLSVTLQGGDASSAEAAMEDDFFKTAIATIPKIHPEKQARYSVENGRILFHLPLVPSSPEAQHDLFVLTQGVTEIGQPKEYATTPISQEPPSLALGTIEPGAQIDAVWMQAVHDRTPNLMQIRFYRDDAAAVADQSALVEKAPAAKKVNASAAKESLSFFAALLFALLGGLILNAMPCVFPILSLKALALARKAEAEHTEVRAHGFAYTLGVLICFATLGGLLLALQAGGRQIGWGFQLQSPGFVGAMASLFFLLGLNLLGVFEFPLFGTSLQVGTKESSKSSFLTGVLAALVATPCTAPFMGSALGAAIGKPPAIAMGIFLALGLGMALPFLLLSFFPHWARCLPKPGLWMQRLKEILAFPMLAAALWLFWVMAQQVDALGLAWMLMALWFVGFGAWLWHVLQSSAPLRRRVALLAVFILWALALHMAGNPPLDYASHTNAAALNYVLPNAESYSADRLEKLRADGRPVFIDATAAWCLTCKVNERGALSSDVVKQAFAEKNIAVLVADWTNEDAEITKLLGQFGRNGVPLYLYYPPQSEPKILPQLLTPTNILQAL